MVNKDSYGILGDFDREEGDMAARIKKAWCSALGSPGLVIDGLVHFTSQKTVLTIWIKTQKTKKSKRQACFID